MHIILLLLLLLGTSKTAWSTVQTKLEKGILVLNNETFDDAVANNEYLFVKFYAPWCGYSRNMAADFIKTAEEVAKLQLPVKLAEIDADRHTEIAEKYNIPGFPVLELFRRESILVYKGETRTSEEFISWLQHQIRPAAKQINTVEEAERLITTENIVIIGFFENQTSANATNFLKIADSFAEPTFAITTNEDVFNRYNAVCCSIIMFNNINNDTTAFEEELTLDNMKTFVEVQSTPLVVYLNVTTQQPLFEGKINNFLLLFVSRENEETEIILETIRPIAKQFKNSIVFLAIDVDEDENLETLETFSLRREQVPAAAIIIRGQRLKYKMTGEITADSLKKFVQDFKDDKLNKYVRSEELPENWNNSSVYTLVATNFNNVTNDTEKDVAVFFYSRKCEACEQWLSAFAEIGEHYKTNNDIILAKINIDKNDIEKRPFGSVPAIALYKKNSSEIILYGDEYEGVFGDILNFIESERNVTDNRI